MNDAHDRQDALREERAEPREHQHAGDEDRRRDGGVAERHHEMRDQADLDHDVAGAEAGEIDDAQRLARRLGEDRAPAPDERDGQQHGGGRGRRRRASPRSADSPTRPATARAGRDRKDLRQVLGLHVSGEIGRVVGQLAGVEDVAVGDVGQSPLISVCQARRPITVEGSTPSSALPRRRARRRGAASSAGAVGSASAASLPEPAARSAARRRICAT